MGIKDWFFESINNEQQDEKAYVASLAQISEELRENVAAYIDNNYGKPYISIDEIIQKSKEFCKETSSDIGNSEQSMTDARTIITSEEYRNNCNHEPAKPLSQSNDVKYSISSDCDRQQLSQEANQFVESVNKKEKVDPYRYKGFTDVFIDFVNKSGMDNPDIYKKANVSKSVFSKIISDRTHIPRKGTILALAIALKLNLKETETLLMKAGYTFSNTLIVDLVTVYFITHEIYDIDALNSALYDLDQPLLGSKSY